MTDFSYLFTTRFFSCSQNQPSAADLYHTLPLQLHHTCAVYFQHTQNVLHFFRWRNMRFSIKVGMGMAIYALLASIPDTRLTYPHVCSEWGLVSFMIVMSITLGLTNNSGNQRI